MWLLILTWPKVILKNGFLCGAYVSERNAKTQNANMERYFLENEQHILNRHNEDQLKKEFDRFVERTKGEIDAWSKKGLGWVLERIMAAYMNVKKYQPVSE